MFSRWGALIYRLRRVVVLVSVLVAIGGAALATQTSSALSSGGWLDATSESADVSARLDTEFGAGKSSLIAVFRSTATRADAASSQFQDAIAESVTALRADSRVTAVLGFAETGDRRFVSIKGDAA